jgi:putative ABC transport system ATP-binding protein
MATDTSRDTAISCHGLAKAYGPRDARTRALDGVDLVIARGEVAMIMGPSGCGKTTLLSLIAGLLDADAGQCTVCGEVAADLSPSARARFRRSRLGFVFQAFNLLPALTAAQNVAVTPILGGVPRREAEALATEALGRVGLGDCAGRLPRQLSGGQQQRVAIARAIVHRPPVILCDEPTSALDHDAGQQMMTVLTDQARMLGAALVVVTHDPRIAHFAERIVRMEDGRVVADGAVLVAA